MGQGPDQRKSYQSVTSAGSLSGNRGTGRKTLDSEYILKGKAIEFADRLV